MKVGQRVRIVQNSSDRSRSYKAGEIRTITYVGGNFVGLDNKSWRISINKLEVAYDFNDYLKELN